MPKGEHLKGENNPGVKFSTEYQPENRRKPDLITSLLREELAGDGWAIFEDAEILDENKKPTGQKVRVRVKQTTARAVARRLAANAASGRERSIEIVLDRTEGKVPQDFNVGGQKGNPLEIGLDTSNLTSEEKRNILKLAKKARTNE
jgi:hypothetical protein